MNICTWNFDNGNQRVFSWFSSPFLCRISVSEQTMSADASDFESSSELARQHLRNVTKERLQKLLAATPSLSDISCDVTPEELLAEIAICNGKAIKISVTRVPYQPITVIVPKNSTVLELKAAIRRSFTTFRNRQRAEQRSKERHVSGESTPNISWKYIWRTYYLQNGSIPLIDDKKTVEDYSIANKTQLHFVKKIKVDRRMNRN